VDTRIRKVRDPVGAYDATLLAHAGLERLDRESEITELFSAEDLLPAPGQGALGIECRAGDGDVLDLLQHLHDPHTAAAVGAERAFLRGLEAGCNTPVAALATVEARGAEKVISFHGRCLSPDGERSIELQGEAPIAEALALGERMALRAISEGFKDL
jgi:hydroxymethylbilane synthase